MDNPIIISTSIEAPINKIWEYWNLPVHICNWYFADPSWHCPRATNELAAGKGFDIRMEAKDGSFGFNLKCTYTKIIPNQEIAYTLEDGRAVVTYFEEIDGAIQISTQFEAEKTNSRALQQNGWQSILNNFKNYTISN